MESCLLLFKSKRFDREDDKEFARGVTIVHIVHRGQVVTELDNKETLSDIGTVIKTKQEEEGSK